MHLYQVLVRTEEQGRVQVWMNERVPCTSCVWVGVCVGVGVCLSADLLPVCGHLHPSVCLPVCLFSALSLYLSLSFVSLSASLLLSLSLFMSLHLCVYLAYGPDPACSPRFMKCEQLSRWCISYSGRLCVGFVPQTKAYDTCEPLVAQTHRHEELRLLAHGRKQRKRRAKEKDNIKGLNEE